MSDAQQHIGFTGTRHGMTEAQCARLRNYLFGQSQVFFHHGDCVGADAQAHDIALALRMLIVIHPPYNTRLRAYCRDAWTTRTPRLYLARNRDIVNDSARLIACPQDRIPRANNGTWSTMRYARSVGCPIAIIWPDGALEQR